MLFWNVFGLAVEVVDAASLISFCVWIWANAIVLFIRDWRSSWRDDILSDSYCCFCALLESNSLFVLLLGLLQSVNWILLDFAVTVISFNINLFKFLMTSLAPPFLKAMELFGMTEFGLCAMIGLTLPKVLLFDRIVFIDIFFCEWSQFRVLYLVYCKDCCCYLILASEV